VTLGQNMKVKVNHKRVTLPIVKLGVLSVVQEGYSVVVRTNIGKEPDLSHIPYCVFFFNREHSWNRPYSLPPIGVKLLWDGESFLEVTVPPAFKNRLCGLCGNFNGRRQDDLRMRTGKLARSIAQFGNSWKVGGPKSCSRPDPPPSSSTSPSRSNKLVADRSRAAVAKNNREPLCQRQWEVRIRAVRECNALKALMFAPCHKKVSPVRYFK